MKAMMEFRSWETTDKPEGRLLSSLAFDIAAVRGKDIFFYTKEKTGYRVEEVYPFSDFGNFCNIVIGGEGMLQMREYYRTFGSSPHRTRRNILSAVICNNRVTVDTFPANRVQEMRLFGDDQYKNGALLAFRMKNTETTFEEFEAWYKEERK